MSEVYVEGDRTESPVPQLPELPPSTNVASDWTTAALAHLTVIVTVLLGLGSGVGALIGVLIPLIMYFAYRNRSRFVAYHALQSAVFQAAAVLLYVIGGALFGGVVAIGWTAVGILSVVLVGLLLLPGALLLTAIMVLVLIGFPLFVLGYGIYAAYEVYQGRNFHYWLVGDSLQREMRF